jgi:formate hydrogenlyase subunit 3/multisubunit Na+/H+ antiporter MnhD subunit
MPVIAFLMWLIAALLGTAALAIIVVRSRVATLVIYSLTFASSAFLVTAILAKLAGGAFVTLHLTLPLGLPWLGAHFRLDALAAFFLFVVNFGGAAASLYGIGYGRHESDQHRVLPFFPAFLAGMNLVVLADDAFTFLLSWEFMSLASWALVMAHHGEEGNIRAGYVYIVMASLGTLALLLAFGLLAGPDGNYAFDAMRTQSWSPLWAEFYLVLSC